MLDSWLPVLSQQTRLETLHETRQVLSCSHWTITWPDVHSALNSVWHKKSAIHRTHFNQALARINSYHHFNQALVQSKFISPFQSSAGSEQIHITISNKHKCTASHVTIGVEPIHFARSNKRGCRAQSFHFWFRATSFHHLEKHWRWASSATYGAEHHHSTVYISVAQGNSDALGNNLPPFHKSAGAG